MARLASSAARIPVWGVAALIAVLLLATNRYPTPVSNPALVTYAASDGLNYRVIGDAFPHLPAAGGPDLPHHHMQRFASPWLVGGVASVTGLELDAAFRLCAIALLALIAGLLLSTIRAVRGSPADQLLLIAIFLLQPVATRFYLAFPQIIPDLAFTAGLTAVVRGIALDRAGWILGGMLVAATARQTGLLIVPALAVWALVPGPAPHTAPRTRRLVVVAAAVLAAALYLITDHVSRPFSAPSINSEMVTGLFSWLAHAFSAKALLEFLARGALPFLLPVGLLVLSWRARPAGVSWPVVAPLLTLATVIALQPLFGGPVVTGLNFARLAVLGLPALLVAVAVVLEAVPGRRAPNTVQVAITGLALGLGSMHHITSLVGQSDSRLASAFAALSVAVAAVVLFITWRWRFAPARVITP